MASSIIAAAFEHWRSVRADYELVKESAFRHAEAATNGVLLNAEAMAKGIDAWSLFQGPEARAQRWASEELRDHWRTHPRVTFAQYEREQSYRQEEW